MQPGTPLEHERRQRRAEIDATRVKSEADGDRRRSDRPQKEGE